MKRPAGFDKPFSSDSEESAAADQNPQLDKNLRQKFFKPSSRDAVSRQAYLESVRATIQAAAKDLSVWDADHPEETDGDKKSAPRAGAMIAGVRERMRRQRAGFAKPTPEVLRAKRELREAQRESRLAAKKLRHTWRNGSLRRPFIVVASAIGALILGVLVAVLSPLMSVREIELVGASEHNHEQIAGALQKLQGEPLALVTDRDIYGALVDFKFIQNYSYETVPPSHLTVRVRERVPVIGVKTGDDSYRVLDAAGVTLQADVAELPADVPVASGAAGDPRSAAFAAAAGVLRQIKPELRAQVQEAQATSAQDVTFVMRSGLVVRWGSDAEMPLKEAIFERMRASLADRSVSLIDVSSTQAPVFQ